jgi:acetyl esterase/lipase
VPEAIDFLDELYDNLFQCRESRNIIFMGDEAGGGLALGFAQQLRDRQAKQPSRIILLSPWLDVTHGQIPAFYIQLRQNRPRLFVNCRFPDRHGPAVWSGMITG